MIAADDAPRMRTLDGVDHRAGAVGGSVVYEDQLAGEAAAVEGGEHSPGELLDVELFVQAGCDDGELERRHRGRRR